MYVLAIETTGPNGSAALINEYGKLVSRRVSHEAMSHLKDLVPMIQDMTAELGIGGEDISAVAASIGPGSFTGIRIGVSTARALAQAWGKPCVAVSSLTSFLMRREGEDAPDPEEIICAIFNARRHQVYGFVESLMEEGPYMIEDVLRVLLDQTGDHRVIFFGDGVDAYESIIRDTLGDKVNYEFAPKEVRYQDASDIARAGLRKFQAGETLTYEELLPDYMREAEAEQKLKAGELPISRLPKQE
ncbi:MAG: tRNA (adenosine(37)-N6)-threonylcarbamoyltransferase complex dimerization subunit type 1 TsaB [Firmicutes bacterium]|nr:tRNA (adenosine(37)-N6)-threonylcarbamoyltransferase complex dimerization subunit type 1 TsaB [Bacillota bacterium]